MEVGSVVILIKNSSLQGKRLARYEVPAGQTVLSALNSLGFSAQQPLVAVVNGTTVDMTRLLQPGDVVQCFPQIAGG